FSYRQLDYKYVKLKGGNFMCLLGIPSHHRTYESPCQFESSCRKLVVEQLIKGDVLSFLGKFRKTEDRHTFCSSSNHMGSNDYYVKT
ncbi:MAG: hypothetical protein WBF33_12635, partial [Candidatus Nitrosopolaris sp.]